MRFDPQCPSTLFVALGDPPEGREDEFHEWYDTVHGPDAIANGSFTAVHRFRAVGPGHRAAPFLALWEGRFASEAEAWGYIGPRAQALREAGRVGDIASVRFAIMLFAARLDAGGSEQPAPGQPTLGHPTAEHPTPEQPCEPVAVLTTVQNDWRHPGTAADAASWYGAFAQGAGSQALTRLGGGPRWLATSDPAGRGAGHHLAVFPSVRDAVAVAESWHGLATPGMSPLPPYQTIFGSSAGAVDGADPGPGPAPAWVMHWEPVSTLRA